MLIPHDRGERRSFDLSVAHVWTVVVLVVGLSFVTGFLIKANQIIRARTAELQDRYRELEFQVGTRQADATSPKAQRAFEAEIRAQYEARDKVITAELSRIYDMEAEVRAITGLPPRDETVATLMDPAGGKGGRPGGLGVEPVSIDEVLIRPPQIIYGLARPSADLMMEEMLLRGESLGQLMRAMELQKERIARTPSIWPTTNTERWLSSRFGRRRDPIHGRVRHHDGIDVSTRYGSPVIATARGTVSFAGRDRYFGNLVKIDHDFGVETWYAHMSKLLVKVGDEVERGDQVGNVGSTGRATGTHIHYEIQVNGKPINPQRFLGS